MRENKKYEKTSWTTDSRRKEISDKERRKNKREGRGRRKERRDKGSVKEIGED